MRISNIFDSFVRDGEIHIVTNITYNEGRPSFITTCIDKNRCEEIINSLSQCMLSLQSDFKIGDKVFVINDGCFYPRSEEAKQKMGFKNVTESFFTSLKNKNLDNDIWTIFSIGTHVFSKELMFGIEHEDGTQLLIAPEGIKLI